MDQQQPHWTGPCASVVTGASWDLDEGDLVAWTRALRICQEHCPVKQLCTQRRQEFYPGADRPAGVIWAGVAYSEAGKILDAAGLRRLASASRGRPRARPWYEPDVQLRACSGGKTS